MGTGGEESQEDPRSLASRNALLLLLAGAAGCIDALSYLGLGQVFTANMTGNTVLLGVALCRARWWAVARSGAALVSFLAGVAVGAAVAERGGEDVAWPPSVTAALALEFAALLALAAGWAFAGGTQAVLYCLIFLSALAMGVQSAAVGRLGVSSVSTTFVTGTLTTFTQRSVDRLSSADDGEEPKNGPRLTAGVWLVYLAGATAGGAADVWWARGAILPPLVLVGAVVATRYRGR
jgi:uncharacterized membrane protein YoaK (UPF0700 family)